MCGIVGVAGMHYKNLITHEIADKMCKVIEHRGPDDQGIIMDTDAFIGMRRLSIIDLDTGHQPIHNEDNSVWLVFNGEIYNYRELNKYLVGKGHVFYTKSDAETIVHLYEELGDKCFEMLNGMFAIAIYDKKRKRVVLARDRLGKKPLYYTLYKGNLIFGSELKSFLEIKELPKNLNHRAVQDYLLLGYVPTPNSIYSDVFKLEPATYLTFDYKQIQKHCYWTFDYEPKYNKTAKQLEEELEEILFKSVSDRLVSDVPFGAFLSGGIDSSVVVALMSQIMNQPVKTFSIGFEEEKYSELSDAKVVANHVHSEHFEKIVRADAVELLDTLVWHFDEPFSDSSAIPTFLVSKMAAEKVKMVLSGDGGDEVFAGYTRYNKFKIINKLHEMSPSGVLKSIQKISKVVDNKLAKKIGWYATRLLQDFPENYISGVAVARPGKLKSILRTGFTFDDHYEPINKHFGVNADSLIDKVCYADIKTYLLDDILVKVDRMSMANSLETRAPLLDYRVIEYAARLPVNSKLHGNTGKHILKRIAEKHLPKSILKKKKQGFAIPLADWLRNDLKEIYGDLLGSQGWKESGVFDHSKIVDLHNQHVSNTADNSELLWSILLFQLWADKFGYSA